MIYLVWESAGTKRMISLLKPAWTLNTGYRLVQDNLSCQSIRKRFLLFVVFICFFYCSLYLSVFTRSREHMCNFSRSAWCHCRYQPRGNRLPIRCSWLVDSSRTDRSWQMQRQRHHFLNLHQHVRNPKFEINKAYKDRNQTSVQSPPNTKSKV